MDSDVDRGLGGQWFCRAERISIKKIIGDFVYQQRFLAEIRRRELLVCWCVCAIDL
jgi:hypothetical protein